MIPRQTSTYPCFITSPGPNGLRYTPVHAAQCPCGWRGSSQKTEEAAEADADRHWERAHKGGLRAL